MRARPEEYVIETKVSGIARSTLWTCDHGVDIDLPRGWHLERDGARLVFTDHSNPEQEIVEVEDFEDGVTRVVRLPSAAIGGRSRPLTVSLKKLKAPRPVYVQNPRVAALHTRAPRQLCAFYGQRYFLIHYRPVGPRYTVVQNASPLFTYQKSSQGYAIVAHGTGVQIQVGSRKQPLAPGSQVELNELDFFRATVNQGVHWWRVRMVPTPDGQPPLDSDETDDDLREASRLQYSAVGFLSLVSVLLFATYMAARLIPKEKKVIKTEVTLQQPKVFPAFEEKKPIPPPPPPEVAKVEPPKPPEPEPKPKKEPPKPVAKVKPKKEPRAVAKKAPAAPKQQVAKREPPAQAAPPPVEKAPLRDPGPTPEQVAAQEKAEAQAVEKAQMLKSLNFLSTSKNRPTIDASSYESKEGKFAATGKTGNSLSASKSNVLDKMVKGTPGDGAISTKSGRTLASKISFGKNKGLNDVQGRVSLGELSAKNGDPGGALGGGKGLEMSGPGSLTESQIEQALSKFLSRFQYCYEKSLLSDSSLGGNLVVQWNVTEAGRAGSSRVVKSQLNNADLHKCVLKVLSEVPFPKPKGGEVVVKKTFSFSSASM